MQEDAGVCKKKITGKKIKGSCKHTKERAIIDRERALIIRQSEEGRPPQATHLYIYIVY